MQEWKESQLPVRELGLQLHSMEVSSADKFDGAFNEATKARRAALAVTRHWLANANHKKRIADMATKNRLPAIYPRGDYVGSGDLMSYGADQAEAYQARRGFCGQDSKGCETRRFACGAVDEVPAVHQPESSKGDRPDDSAVDALPRG